MSAKPDYSAFAIYADGDSRAVDLDEVRRALPILMAPGERHEIRSLPGGKCRIVSSDDVEAAVKAVSELDGTLYFSLNPIAPDADRAKASTVTHRRWLLIDVDPVRPADVSSTETEKADAAKVVDAVLDGLGSAGWPEPIVADSGNGWHVLYRIDLPNDKLAHAIVKKALAGLGGRYGTTAAKIDAAVHDAPRICKLPGTWSRKGVDAPERPHRRAMVMFAPERIEAVAVELLQAAGEKPKAKDDAEPKAAANDPFTVQAASGSTLTNYTASAITRECVAVSLAPEGDRNNRLNVAAFNLGTMAGWPEMDGVAAVAALHRAAESIGLREHEIRQTIKSGWEAGKANARERPAEQAAASSVAKIPEGVTLTIGAHEVVPEKVTWLWEDRIAVGFISLFAGRTGVGKSFVLCDIAAKLSRGDAFPDGSPPRPIGGTLFISEDPYQYVLVPRLIELKADLRHVGFMKWEAMATYSLADTAFLDRAWEERGRPSLIVIDPPANFLGASDEHKNSEVRGVLMKIVAWLESRAVAMVLITHYNKGGGQGAVDALDRIMGSVAWSSSSRVACGFMVDPGDQSKCVFGGIKNNLGQKAEPLSYRITKTETLAVVEWLGRSDTTLDDALSKRVPRVVNGIDFLVKMFREKRIWISDELYAIGKSGGVSRDALFEAKKTLPIRAVQVAPQDGGSRYWTWEAAPGWPPEENECDSATLRSCEDNSLQGKELRRVARSDTAYDSAMVTQSRRIAGSQGGEGADAPTLEKKALQLLSGLLFGGPVERNTAIVAAAEQDIPLSVLMIACNRYGVEVSIKDGKEFWSIP